MSYSARIGGAIVASLLLNLALLMALPHAVRGNVSLAENPTRERAIRLDFRPPESELEQNEALRRLIDPGAAAERPVGETDLISSQDSQAQDNSDAEGDPAKPAVDEIDDFDQLGTPPAMPSEPVAVPPPAPEPLLTETPTQPAPELAAPVAEPRETGTVLARAEPAEAQPEPVAPLKSETDLEELTPVEQTELEPTPERFKVADAAPPAVPSRPLPVQELRSTRGREDGGATDSGFTSFEATRHELGEYMLLVRKAVEREWRTTLRLRYTGVSRTEALIACSIRPDGTLEYARVVDAGSSLTYAVLCRQAIEQAAPFAPFPFTVPEIYRKDNLEITWKFSYL